MGWYAASGLGFRLSPYLALLCVAAAVLFPLAGEYWARPSNPLRHLMTDRRAWFLLLLTSAFIIRMLFLFFCSIYPDEYSVLQVLTTQPLSHPIEFALNYRQLAGIEWVHPPLAFFLMSIGYSVWPTIYGARLIAFVLSMVSVVAVYYIVKNIGTVDLALIACALYVLVPQTVLFMTPAITDSFANLFGILSVLLYLVALNTNLKRYVLLSGFFLGLSFLSKLGIPIEWVIAIILLTVAYKDHAGFLCMACAAAAVTYAPWLAVNPQAAIQPNLSAISVIAGSLLAPNIGPIVLPPPSTQLPVVFLQRLSSGANYISMSELLFQMAFWLTPLLILLAAAGVLQSLAERSRKNCSIAIWLLLPLVGATLKIRDVRYLLPMTVPFVYFAARGLKVNSPTLQKRLRSLAIGFTLVFLAISFVVAQQQYVGPPEAASTLESLGLSNRTILSNFDFHDLLPNATIVILGMETTPTQALDLVALKRVDAVVILHHIRGAWPQPLPETVDVLKPLFKAHVSGGPSDFAWYEIFYERRPVACQLQEDDVFLTHATLAMPVLLHRTPCPCSSAYSVRST